MLVLVSYKTNAKCHTHTSSLISVSYLKLFIIIVIQLIHLYADTSLPHPLSFLRELMIL